jgi:hypothetical protein
MRKPWLQKLVRPFTSLLLTGALFGGIPAVAHAQDQFNPPVVTLTLGAGASATVNKVLHLEAAPQFADIIIAIDTTGSMAGAIAEAKAEAIQICNDVKAQIPGARFAVVDFKDYPIGPYGGAGDFPYLLRTPGFVADCATFAAAIAPMAATGGGDLPESYNRVFFEAYSDPVLVASRNPAASQFLVVLGDAPPHDPTQTVAPACGNRPPIDPGRDGIPGTADDLETEDTIAGLNAADITLLMIRYNNFIPLACYEELAAATGGDAVDAGSGGSLSEEIADLVAARAAQINTVNLEVSAGCPLGISFSPVPPYGPFTAPVDIPFTETIVAPTVPGAFSCTVTAVVDGARRAVQVINVGAVPGPPARLTLEPDTAINTVDEQHCVTATVTDAFGNPNAGVSVEFSVTPPTFRTPSEGSATTDGNGQAEFCYTSALPGVDAIHAFADTNANQVQDVGEPFDDATKEWVLPTSTASCKVTNGGHIRATNGDRATFGGNARVDAGGNPRGEQQYHDHGPATPMNVHSINVLAVVCRGTEASIFGEATIDGQGSFDYRIDVEDHGEPGKNRDKYQIRLGNGYDSGDQILQGGNIQIHK